MAVPPFQGPTSVILHGPCAPLLGWVAWAFASGAPGGYRWTEVSSPGQTLDPLGPVARGKVPKAQWGFRDPQDLRPDNARANAAITAGLRSDGEQTELEQLADFLRLPEHTRRLISSLPVGGPPFVLVVSHGQRLLPQYNIEATRSAIQTLVARGLVLFNVFSAKAGDARFLFQNVWRLDADELRSWRTASLDVEQAGPSGPILAKGPVRLTDLPIVASALTEATSGA